MVWVSITLGWCSVHTRTPDGYWHQKQRHPQNKLRSRGFVFLLRTSRILSPPSASGEGVPPPGARPRGTASAIIVRQAVDIESEQWFAHSSHQELPFLNRLQLGGVVRPFSGIRKAPPGEPDVGMGTSSELHETQSGLVSIT